MIDFMLTGACVNCRHWDHWDDHHFLGTCEIAGTKDGWESTIPLAPAYAKVRNHHEIEAETELITRGDFGCRQFEAKAKAKL